MKNGFVTILGRKSLINSSTYYFIPLLINENNEIKVSESIIPISLYDIDTINKDIQIKNFIETENLKKSFLYVIDNDFYSFFFKNNESPRKKKIDEKYRDEIIEQIRKILFDTFLF